MSRHENPDRAKKRIMRPPAGLRNNAFPVQFTTRGMYADSDSPKPVGAVNQEESDKSYNTEDGFNS